MPSADKSFRDLELLNVKIDVWIDEEEYDSVANTLKPAESGSTGLIEKIFRENTDGDDTKIGEKELDGLFKELFNNLNNPSENLIRISENGEEVALPKKNRNWAPLFFAKYIRAKILQKGTDDYTQHLEDLVIYLQRNLPHQFPKIYKHLITQHLYFQELSACGKPGLESLGFAVQAYHILDNKDDVSRKENRTNLTLYKLWARLNQGIGYWHSNQKREAIQAFDEIIKGFEDASKYKKGPDKRVWASLILHQAILFKGEVQEDSQFSYHTLQTLSRLKKSNKRERRLIKEALAYRDMGRLSAAKSKINDLLSYSRKKHYDSVSETFQQFSRWENRTNKKSLGSQILGLLFDYYLQEFQELGDEKKTDLEDDIENLANNFICYKSRLLSCVPDRRSYYQQAARFLEWLSVIRGKIGDQRPFFDNQIRRLYGEIREELPGICAVLRGLKEKVKIDLNEFGRYEYDRFVNSMEKFYRKINDSNSEDCGIKKEVSEIDFLDDEISFLEALNKFERHKQWLYSFKDLERRQRKQSLKTKKTNCDRGKPLKCFLSSLDSTAFDGILNCAEKIKEKNNYELCEYFRTGLKPMGERDYESIMKRENKRFLDYLKLRSRHPLLDKRRESYHFFGLQRWNSQTPTLTLSQGGGYFIYQQDRKGQVVLGIAIDPGFDFVDNLFHMGFTLRDIDFILMSHAHLDHMRDFEPIVSALLDLKKRTTGQVKKKIHVMMSLGVYHRVEHVITNPTLREYLSDTYIVDIDKTIEEEYLRPFRFKRDGRKNKAGNFVSVLNSEEENYEIEITPTKAYHNDYSEESDSFGYIIKMFDRNNKAPLFSFGYTGDTKWEKSLLRDWGYHECDVVCIHLGALIESEKDGKNKFSYYKGPQCEALIEKKGHPYLFGLLRFLKQIKEIKNTNKLILISEFGEELKGGIRIDLIHRLNHILEDKGVEGKVCLPVDIGLNVILARQSGDSNQNQRWETTPYKVWCYGCDRFVEAEKIGYRHFGYGRDEALFYFCDTCLKSKPDNVIQDKMRSICEHGIPLQKAE
ncbi:MAG: hypothetical protein JRI77_05655 [Deltaproteobacteria bacterium]|nr:hypothetical protein [Deltaproteobacteria bacterium]